MTDHKQRSIRHQLARSIRVFRILRGWSQERLGDYCGLHRTFIGAVERSERNITVDNIEKIAAALEVSVSKLFSEYGLPSRADSQHRFKVKEIRPCYHPTPNRTAANSGKSFWIPPVNLSNRYPQCSSLH